MNKICTTIEQSKKLMELGIDVNTADMFYADLLVDSNHKYNLHPLESYGFKTFEETKLKTSEHLSFIPAWSLPALLELTPTFTLNGFGNGQFNFRDERANNYALVDTCPLDAAFEMVVWLKENGKL